MESLSCWKIEPRRQSVESAACRPLADSPEARDAWVRTIRERISRARQRRLVDVVLGAMAANGLPRRSSADRVPMRTPMRMPVPTHIDL